MKTSGTGQANSTFDTQTQILLI